MWNIVCMAAAHQELGAHILDRNTSVIVFYPRDTNTVSLTHRLERDFDRYDRFRLKGEYTYYVFL